MPSNILFATTLLLAVVVAPAACAGVPETNYEAVAAAPDSHEVLLENEEVRVLRVTIAPGMSEPVHEHSWPSVMYFEQPQPIVYVAYEEVDGELVETNRVEAPAMPAGLAVWGEPEGLHSVENRGAEPFVALRVEFKPRSPPGN